MVSEGEVRRLCTEMIHFDSLIVAKWTPENIASVQQAGITGVSCTTSIWDNFSQSIKEVIIWKKWFEEYSNHIIQAHTVTDVRHAKTLGETAVLLSWQNTAGIEDQIDHLRVFRDLGVRKRQLTCNTQSYYGAGYGELSETGLTGFGREVVDEMAKLGIVVDFSHVGDKTSEDIVRCASKPPCSSHCAPRGLVDRLRKKQDLLLELCAERGSYIGINCFGPHMPKGNNSTIFMATLPVA